MTLRGERIAEEFQQIVDDYVARKYARRDTDVTTGTIPQAQAV